jgi:cellulose synthase (UDP-forming)
MRTVKRHVANVFAAVLVGLLVLVFTGAATLPMTGILPRVEQSFVFGLMLLLYNYDGGYRKHRKRPMLRVAISVLTIFLTLRYLDWRLTETLPFGFGVFNIILGIILIFAEMHGIISAITGQIINVMPLDRTSPALPAHESDYPGVDILIPTYNEDPALVETTVIAATQLRYPTSRYRVYILDDGGTGAKCAKPGNAGAAARARAAELRRVAATYGATYLTRPDNLRAKAGNINHALQHIDSELILILDCDHVPTDDILERTVAFFLKNPKLFLLQTPHNFVTPDPIERNLNTFVFMPAENELFYNVMQPGLDFWGAAFFCGSAAIIRRSVLDEIGGISGKSITEDAETTIKAMRRGYQTAFYNRSMVSGLQPETFSGFILQRMRWAQGMIQIFVLDNVWFKPGLTIMQRLLFTNFAFYWLFPVSRAILLAMPPLFLFFGCNVAVTTPQELLLYAVPYYLAAILNAQYFYGRVRWPFISQIYETAQTVFLCAGIFSVLRNPRAPTFKVTPKGEVLDKDFISSLAWPFYWLLGLAGVSLGIGVWRILTQPQLRWALIFVGFWVLLDMLALLGVIGALAERKQRRAMPRMGLQAPIQIRANGGPWQESRTHDLSRHGAGLALPDNFSSIRTGDQIEILFGGSEQRLQGKIRHVGASDGERIAGLQYDFKTPVESRLAVAVAFGSSANLERRAAERHSGINMLYALWFLAKIGVVGSCRHFSISLLIFARRLRVAWETRAVISLLHATSGTVSFFGRHRDAGQHEP